MNEVPQTPARSRRKLWIAGAAVLVVALAVGTWLWLRHTSAPKGPTGPSMSDQEFLALFQGPPDTFPSYLREFRNNEEFRETFPQEIAPPKLDTTLDLNRFTLEQIRYLHHFVAARHGFLFQDMVLRAFFNRFPWYQPIWTTENFQPRLAPWEERWQKRLAEREAELARGIWTTAGGAKRANIAALVNRMMFEGLSPELMGHLDADGFAIVAGDHRQLWHVYDKNQYDGIPSLVTTDLYLQLLHMHFKYLMKGLEREQLIPALAGGLGELRVKLQAMPQVEGTLRAEAIVALAQALLENGRGPLQSLPDEVRNEAQADYDHALDAQVAESALLSDTLFDWGKLIPRGHYDGSDSLRGYFRALKWLGSARLKFSGGHEATTLALASAWKRCGPEGPEGFRRISRLVDALSGPANSLSLTDVVQASSGDPANVAGEALAKLVKELKAKDPARIHARGGNAVAKEDLATISVRVFPLRWSGDAEILQRLVHVERPKPLRPFPSGLDVFAVRGVELAHTILVDEEKVTQAWPAWADTFAVLRKTPELLAGSDFHSRRMGLLQNLFEIPDNAPPFQKTPQWTRHALVTGLAGWTLQKQENILYQEQAEGAECGEGGGPPPPDPKGWVDPNPAFWNGAAAVVRSVDSLLTALKLQTESVKELDGELLKDFGWLADAAQRELDGKELTKEQLQGILWIGGRVEGLTFRATGLQPEVFDKSEEGMAAAAVDVYSYNGTVLEEATATADELWAMVEIGGFLHLARGAVFSHRQWQSTARLTDRQWHAKVESKDIPGIPAWQAPLFVKGKAPGTLPTTSGLLGAGACR